MLGGASVYCAVAVGNCPPYLDQRGIAVGRVSKSLPHDGVNAVARQGRAGAARALKFRSAAVAAR
jgi:hypothetical protein